MKTTYQGWRERSDDCLPAKQRGVLHPIAGSRILAVLARPEVRWCFYLMILHFACVQTQAAPTLDAPKFVDLGRASPGEPKKMKITVKNNSSAAVTISAIKTSCGCTEVEMAGSNSIGSGEERFITGVVNFGNTIGAFETDVRISYLSASKVADQLVIPIRGNVVAAVVLEKTRVDFRNVDLEAGPQEVKVGVIRGNSGEEWDYIGGEGGTSHVHLTFQQRGTEPAVIVCRLDPAGLPISAFRESIKLKAFNRGTPLPLEIELAVVARITGPLTATPSSLNLGSVAPGDAVDRVVTISGKGLDLKELIIERQPQGTVADLEHLADGMVKLRVKAELEPKEPPIMIKNLQLLHQTTGVRLNIPIFGIIKRADDANK